MRYVLAVVVLFWAAAVVARAQVTLPWATLDPYCNDADCTDTLVTTARSELRIGDQFGMAILTSFDGAGVGDERRAVFFPFLDELAVRSTGRDVPGCSGEVDFARLCYFGGAIRRDIPEADTRSTANTRITHGSKGIPHAGLPGNGDLQPEHSYRPGLGQRCASGPFPSHGVRNS